MTVSEDFICFTCKHWNTDKPGCKAFEEIPVEVILEIGHDNVIEGQNGNFIHEGIEQSM
ncbi:MAG: hypothetical protein RLZZ546_913 [Bacteroidota bacterium]|jgi:hypothetical protein